MIEKNVETDLNLIIDNYPINLLKPILMPLKNKIVYPKLEDKNELYQLICNNVELNKVFLNDIYYQGTVLEKMELLNYAAKGSIEYEKLYQDIIKVGEYQIK